MKLPQALALSLAITGANCAGLQVNPELPKGHSICIDRYNQQRELIFEVLESRGQSFRDLKTEYGIDPMYLGDVRDFNSQAYEHPDICGLINSQIYWMVTDKLN